MTAPSTRPRRRALVARLGLAIALAAFAIGVLAGCSSSAAPSLGDPAAQGTALVNEFFTMLQQPETTKADQLKGFLAPEFQVVRANGDQVAKDEYLGKAPSVKTYAIADVKATQGGDVLVVSYKITTEETVNGVQQSTVAPRLSVFRWTDGAWKLAAHSNFGAITP